MLFFLKHIAQFVTAKDVHSISKREESSDCLIIRRYLCLTHDVLINYGLFFKKKRTAKLVVLIVKPRIYLNQS